MVTMAKALGNGMPVGACWARAEVAAAFGPGDHGGDLRGPAAGAWPPARATLAVMEAEDVCRRARGAGARLADGLARLPGVVSVRGAGLLLAAQLRGARGQDGLRRWRSSGACSSTRSAPTRSGWHRPCS